EGVRGGKGGRLCAAPGKPGGGGGAPRAPSTTRFSSGSYLPGVQTAPPLRLSPGSPFQLASQGEPGCAIVLVRHASFPPAASRATIKQPPPVPGLVQPEMPAIALPLATSGPPVNV